MRIGSVKSRKMGPFYGLLHTQCNRATLIVIARSAFCDEAIASPDNGIASRHEDRSQ
jgi:hypothetical protein